MGKSGANDAPMDDQGFELAGWKVEQLDFPTFRIGLLAKLMDRVTIRALARDTNLSYAQWRVLVRLGLMAKGATVRDLAALAWVDRAEVSRALGALEKLGMVARHDNPADGRAPIMSLTAQGERTYRDVLSQRTAFHERLLANLSTDDRATLDGLLGRIGEQLMAEIGEG